MDGLDGGAAIWRQRAGLGIACAWVAFWAWFAVADGSLDGPIGVLMHLIPAILFGLLTYLAWAFPKAGPWGLVLIGVAITIAYPLTWGRRFPFATTVFIWLTMGWPPILAGVLMLPGRPRPTGG